MKKLLLVISLLFSVYMLLHVLNILVYDLDRLTDYGYGYLTGKIVLLLLLGTFSFIMTRKIYFSKK